MAEVDDADVPPLPETPEGFDRFYATTPAWDIGEPQPAFLDLVRRGLLRGRVLDVGCGTGEHALLAASLGLDAVGIDGAPTAIEQARAKAAGRGLPATFVLGDVLDLASLVEGPFDTVIDSALFHVFSDEQRVRYAGALRNTMNSGGFYFMLVFSDQVPGTAGPRRVSEAEIRGTFSDGWTVTAVQPSELQVIGMAVPAWFATVRRD